MPAKISKSSAMPETIDTLMAFSRLGLKGCGAVFVDEAGNTYIGTMPIGATAGNLKPLAITSTGHAIRLAERGIRWPLKLAPKDHIVTFSNED